MATDYKFEGWMGLNPDAIKGEMKWGGFEPKVWQEDDVDIEISHCGICGSDLHTLRSGWGETNYPCCVGHEIVGKAVKVGSRVKHIAVGDRVGVGAQARSCLRPDCPACSTGRENYCLNDKVNTYDSKYPNNEGMSYGGYATHNRTHSRFVFRIPEGLASEYAAPMMCGGITLYSPLRNNGCGPGKRVGIVGVGGLGHFGVLFAKALGADRVVGISRRSAKREQVLKLGADEYIATEDDKDWATKHAGSVDLIISTVSNANIPLSGYLKLLSTYGTFIQVGAPDGGKFPPINVFELLSSGVKIGGSGIGSPAEIEEMLQLAADKKIYPWVEKRPMSEANQAVRDMVAEKARYRYVLVNEDKA